MATPAKKPAAPAPVAVAPEFDVVKTVEAAAAPARGLQEAVSQAAEKGVAETRAIYARVKVAAEEASDSLEKSAKTTAEGVLAFNHKVVDALRANTDANFDFVKSLLGVKSLSEAIALNSEHVRKQFEAVSAQGKDLSSLAQKLAVDAYAPLKDSFGKVFAARG